MKILEQGHGQPTWESHNRIISPGPLAKQIYITARSFCMLLSIIIITHIKLNVYVGVGLNSRKDATLRQLTELVNHFKKKLSGPVFLLHNDIIPE